MMIIADRTACSLALYTDTKSHNAQHYRQTDRRTDGRTDGHDDANSRSYCVAVRSANKTRLILHASVVDLNPINN